MATEFYVALKDLDRTSLPEGLVETAGRGRLQIGTCYGNPNRRRDLSCLVQEKYGEWLAGTFSSRMYVSIEELASSKKLYYSKWDRESPIEFFNTNLRFCWYIPTELQGEGDCTGEDFQRGMLDFWDSILRENTPIHHSSTYQIDVWKDLREAIFGDNRYMEPSRFVQGTYALFRININ